MKCNALIWPKPPPLSGSNLYNHRHYGGPVCVFLSIHPSIHPLCVRVCVCTLWIYYGTCLERPPLERLPFLKRPVSKLWTFLSTIGFHAQRTCLERPPLWKDHFILTSRVVVSDRFYCTSKSVNMRNRTPITTCTDKHSGNVWRMTYRNMF